MNTTPITPSQRRAIAETIERYLWEELTIGEIDEQYLICEPDLGGLAEDCEISLNVHGDCSRIAGDRLTPDSKKINVRYEGEATFFKHGTAEYLYSAPVSGRYQECI